MSQRRGEAPALAKDIILSTIGMFYEPVTFILMRELLHQHTGVNEEYLKKKLSLETKLIRQELKALYKHRLVKRVDISVGKQFFSNVESKASYWFIDYKDILDVIQWRINKMKNKLEKLKNNDTSSMNYKCEKCERLYLKAKAVKYIDMKTGLMHCEVCHGELVDCEPVAKVDSAFSGAEQKVRLFREQLDPIIQKIDRIREITLPLNIVQPIPNEEDQAKLDEEISALVGKKYTDNTRKNLKDIGRTTVGAPDDQDSFSVELKTDTVITKNAKELPEFLRGDLIDREVHMRTYGTQDVKPVVEVKDAFADDDYLSKYTSGQLQSTGVSIDDNEADDDEDEEMGDFEEVEDAVLEEKPTVSHEVKPVTVHVPKPPALQLPPGSMLFRGQVMDVTLMTDDFISQFNPAERDQYNGVVRKIMQARASK